MENGFNGIDRELNAAILNIAARLFPTGFDVHPCAPSNLKDLTEQCAWGRMVVWDGASAQTIYDDAEVNFAFRAWHDWHHVKGQFEFDIEGERKACEAQIELLYSLYGESEKTRYWARLIDAEIMGQAFHFEQFGTFPENQIEFVKAFAAAARGTESQILDAGPF